MDLVKAGGILNAWALGFTGPHTGALVDQLGVALDERGNIVTDARGATNVPGVYCAGDAHRGASLIVWAIAEGRAIARARRSFCTGPFMTQHRASMRTPAVSSTRTARIASRSR